MAYPVELSLFSLFQNEFDLFRPDCAARDIYETIRDNQVISRKTSRYNLLWHATVFFRTKTMYKRVVNGTQGHSQTVVTITHPKHHGDLFDMNVEDDDRIVSQMANFKLLKSKVDHENSCPNTTTVTAKFVTNLFTAEPYATVYILRRLQIRLPPVMARIARFSPATAAAIAPTQQLRRSSAQVNIFSRFPAQVPDALIAEIVEQPSQNVFPSVHHATPILHVG